MSAVRGKAAMPVCTACVCFLPKADTLRVPGWPLPECYFELIRLAVLRSLGPAMRRREFITLIGAAAAWPPAAIAQQPAKVWRIGFLAGGIRPINLEGTSYGAFLRGMRELGYVENQNFIVEWRFAEGRLELLPTLAEELVRLNVDVIVVGLTAAIPIVQRATSTIPIVMAISVDPVGNGYVSSLAHPTGNVTGLASPQD